MDPQGPEKEARLVLEDVSYAGTLGHGGHGAQLSPSLHPSADGGCHS